MTGRGKTKVLWTDFVQFARIFMIRELVTDDSNKVI